MKQSIDTLSIANLILALYKKAKSDRCNLEELWKQIVVYVRPQDSIIDKTHEIFDTTAISSAECLVSGIWGLISSSASNWFHFNIKESAIEEGICKEEARQWVNLVNKIMRENLLDAEGGFYHKTHEFYSDLVCFGTAVFYVGEDINTLKINFKSCSIQNTYILNLSNNNIDTVIRELFYTTSNLISIFGEENLPSSIVQTYKQGDSRTHKILHIVAPYNYFKDKCGVKNNVNMKFLSCYVDEETGHVLNIGGYYEFPYMISRWNTLSNDLYGKSPAMSVLADIKMLNAISKTIIISAQKQVDPPILAPNESAIQGIRTSPGGIIYGAIDPVSGATLIKPLNLESNLSYSNDLQNQKQKSVREAFYNSLLLFSYSYSATATEVLSVNEQKLRMLGFKIAKLQSEFLHPLLLRQYLTLKRLHVIPKPKFNVEDTDVQIQFVGPWNRYQKMLDSIGLQNLQHCIQTTKSLDPDVVNIIDWKEVIKKIAEGNGVPSSVFKSIETK